MRYTSVVGVGPDFLLLLFYKNYKRQSVINITSLGIARERTLYKFLPNYEKNLHDYLFLKTYLNG